jgi:hypothetical protein
MTEIQNPQQLAFDLICNLMLAICYFRFIWDRGYLSLFQSTAAKYQGFFFAKKKRQFQQKQNWRFVFCT